VRPLRLGVNIDHVATVRNARGGRFPDPVRAAEMAIKAGADGITAHLREDRRHISDADIEALNVLTRDLCKPLNFEMAVTEEMEAIALRHLPHAACLVPERREERTTEGGLDIAGGHNRFTPVIRRLADAGIRVSLFVEADPTQIEAAHRSGAQVVEFHAGAYCDAVLAGHDEDADRLLARLKRGAAEADALGLEVHVGHGLDFETAMIVSAIPQVQELNIGHFLVGEAIFVGLEAAIRTMRESMDAGREAG
jgi:pyridoxine 5-phosphate synthase